MKNLSISSSKGEYANIPKFIIKLTLFLSIPTLLISALALYLSSINALPAPVLTGRVSFDEKARFIYLHPFDKLDILATGSSMAMYNLSSEVVFENINPNARYFNFGSWGMKIEDSALFLDHLSNKFEPDVVIIVTSPFDFYSNENPLRLDMADYDRYISGTGATGPLYFYLRYHDPSLLWRARTLREQRTQTDIYLSLKFDRGGGVSIDPPRESISPELWNAKFYARSLNNSNYDALEKRVADLSSKGILTIVVQSPMRAHFLTGDDIGVIEHWQRLDTIVSQNGGHFINMHSELKLGDEHFVDWGHLNSKGSKIFSRELFNVLEQRNIFVDGRFDTTITQQADLTAPSPSPQYP